MIHIQKRAIRLILILVPMLLILTMSVPYVARGMDAIIGRNCTTLDEAFILPPAPENGIRFAVIGDYGVESEDAERVANVVMGWSPDFIITVGDNNYQSGSAHTIDQNIGQYYHTYIGNYQGTYGIGAEQNRFFPAMGNHDTKTEDGAPYLDFFDLPGNERYYDFVRGPVHFFVVNSTIEEPDGTVASSAQARWLQARLAASTSAFNIVYMHHAPYSSGRHGPHERVQWPFRQWGADAVLSGHDHTYERIVQDGLSYFVNGLGGKSKHRFSDTVSGSQAQYNCDYGAMLVDATDDSVEFRFINTEHIVVDYAVLPRDSR